jgi:hypothetical protein
MRPGLLPHFVVEYRLLQVFLPLDRRHLLFSNPLSHRRLQEDFRLFGRALPAPEVLRRL